MKLLILIPMYNSERFIKECLTSLVNQDIDMKIVVIDDASTDNSVKIASTFKEVAIVKNSKNMGTYYSVNVGLHAMSNETDWTHYTIHGSDDISLRDRFKTQLNVFKDRTGIAVGCKFIRTDYITGKTKPTNPNTNESVLIFDRRIFNEIGYYDNGRMACDTEYKRRMLLRFPNSIFNVNMFLIKSYLHNSNLTKKIPLGGTLRKNYVARFTQEHQKMKIKNNFYKDFTP